jgi:hypothetical protein
MQQLAAATAKHLFPLLPTYRFCYLAQPLLFKRTVGWWPYGILHLHTQPHRG